MHGKAASLALTALSWVWPVAGEVLTPYGYGADPFAAGQHRGIDVRAAPGTPVVAAVGGTVRFAGSVGASGLTATVRSSDGRYDTSYLHLSEITAASGQRVAAGDRIGAAGTTGSPSSATPHLHFGVRVANNRDGYRDPLSLLPQRPARVPRLGPAPRAVPVVVPPRLPGFARGEPARVSAEPLDLGWAVACLALISLVALLGRSSIGASCRTTSPRPSTTSTASRISATSTRPLPPTSSPATCASAATTSSS